jgi:hypothetical protein
LRQDTRCISLNENDMKGKTARQASANATQRRYDGPIGGVPMKRKPQASTTQEADITADTPEYLAGWAKELVKLAGNREARLALAEYRRLAADKKIPKAERKAAAERAKAIEKYL